MVCTTSSGNVKVEVEVDLLSEPTMSLTHPRALLRLTPASWPQRAWGMGPGAWAGLECGGQGGRAARIRVSQLVVVVVFLGSALGWAPKPADERQAQAKQGTITGPCWLALANI